MPAVLKHPGAGMVVPAPASPTHGHGHRGLMVAAGVVLAMLVGLTTWTLVDRLTGHSETVATPAPAVSTTPFESYVVFRVVSLQQTLRDNGYAVAVTGMLDPVSTLGGCGLHPGRRNTSSRSVASSRVAGHGHHRST